MIALGLKDDIITEKEIENGITDEIVDKVSFLTLYLGVIDSTKTLVSLDNLEVGTSMFRGCSNLKYFDYQLPNLREGAIMFAESGIKKWNLNLPSLVNSTCDIKFYKTILKQLEFEYPEGVTPELMEIIFSNYENIFVLENISATNGMFTMCQNLETFVGDVKSLIDARCMFKGCSSLKEFNGYLSSLEYGNLMFCDCKLNSDSILHILLSIPQRETMTQIPEFEDENFGLLVSGCVDGAIDIGIDCTEDSKDDFAKEIDFNTFDELTEAFTNKNWIVRWQFNGEAASTYSLKGPKKSSPVYITLSEVKKDVNFDTENYKKLLKHFNVTPDKLEKAYKKIKPQYQSEDGKFYNIHVISDSNNLSGYTRFESLEAALDYYKLVPYVED
jgi:hypothetical protein